jgi:hypothetical protein
MLVLSLAVTAVSFAEAPLQPQCLDTIGLRAIVESDPNATGDGVAIGMVELSQSDTLQMGDYAFLPNMTHQAFAATKWGSFNFIEYPDRPPAPSCHASIIAAILTGADDHATFEGLGKFRYRGVAPAARLNVYETHWFLYKRALTQQIELPDDDVLTISWGTQTDDFITAWWQRGIDALVERESCLVVAGCGNGPVPANSITRPAQGYNLIAVGAARAMGGWPDSLQYVGWNEPGRTGCGPTPDGRAKPDLIAPAAVLGPDEYSQNEYRLADEYAGGSSFAAPQVAGVAALLIQTARREAFINGDDPRLIKALLLNGADKLAGWHPGRPSAEDDHRSPLDYLQGAGLINAANSHRQLLAGPMQPETPAKNTGWDVNTVVLNIDDPNSQRIYYLEVPLAEGQTFKAALCWYQHYQTDRFYSPLPPADLALELWAVDDDGNPRTQLYFSDSKTDNLEHIYYHSPSTQKVALVVRTAVSAANPKSVETYAVAWTSEEQNWPGDRLRGDLNGDGVVNTLDAQQIIRLWLLNRIIPSASGLTAGPAATEDLNLDDAVNTDDFNLLMQQWQQHSDWYIASQPQ